MIILAFCLHTSRMAPEVVVTETCKDDPYDYKVFIIVGKTVWFSDNDDALYLNANKLLFWSEMIMN